MTEKRSRKRVLEEDLVANDQEVADFLAAFGHRPTKPPAAVKVKAPKVKATAARKPHIRNLAEAIWLAEVHADEKENRRHERTGLPPLQCRKTWEQIRDGVIIPADHC